MGRERGRGGGGEERGEGGGEGKEGEGGGEMKIKAAEISQNSKSE